MPASQPDAGGHCRDHLRILMLTAWYPSEENAVSGVFVKEMTKAAALYDDVVVLHAYPNQGTAASSSLINEIDDGLRTIRVRHGTHRDQAAKAQAGSPKKQGIRSNPITRGLRFASAFVRLILYYLSLYRGFRFLVRSGWRPDVIHAHVYTAGVPAVLLGKLYGIPVMITEHASAFPRGLVRGPSRTMARFAFKYATLVCPVSQSLRESIRAQGIDARFQVIPNVVDTSRFHPRGHQQMQPPSRKRLLFVALLSPKKGLDTLLTAVSLLRKKQDDITLDIIGDGPERNHYEQISRELGLSDIVTFHGLKGKAEVADFMRHSDVLVVSSLVETFCVVAAEALATGIPVVATRCGGPEGFVNNNCGVLVAPNDPADLCQGLHYVLDNLKHYSSEAIAEYATAEFGPEAVGSRLHAIYRCLVQK